MGPAFQTVELPSHVLSIRLLAWFCVVFVLFVRLVWFGSFYIGSLVGLFLLHVFAWFWFVFSYWSGLFWFNDARSLGQFFAWFVCLFSGFFVWAICTDFIIIACVLLCFVKLRFTMRPNTHTHTPTQ